MLSDWCKGVAFTPSHKHFGLAVQGQEGSATFGPYLTGEVIKILCSVKKPYLLFHTITPSLLILPINLCKWETEE